MDILLVLAVGTLNIACFLIGYKAGKKEELNVAIPNPIKAYHEHQDRKEADRIKEKLETIAGNIDRYDGTSQGQEDV